MLRFIAFENLINFKDRQYLKFKDGVNFLVGANSTGKSSILELIRRCHSVKLSSSVTNLLDDNTEGYIITRYEGLSDVVENNDTFDPKTAVLCFFQERKDGIISIYRCICFKSTANEGFYIAASQYDKEEGEKEKIIRRFSLQHIDVKEAWVVDFTSEYFPKETDPKKKSERFKQEESGTEELEIQRPEELMKVELNDNNQNELAGNQNKEKEGHCDENIFPENFFDESETQAGAESRSGDNDTQNDKTQEDTNRIDKKTPKKRTESDFLAKVKAVLQQSIPGKENSNKTSERLMENLQSSFVHIFPGRSIGPLQWINGNNVGELDSSKNYENAQKRAEILWELLPPVSPQGEQHSSIEEYINIDENEHNSLFKKVTYPLEYEFEKCTKKIEVTHKNDPGSCPRRFELFKAPEGIIEAKQATLVLSHKKFKTICYEDIDRGMHNQMIENLNNFVLKEIKGKTVIIVTHNPSLINRWAFGRTHVCTRQKEQKTRDQEGGKTETEKQDGRRKDQRNGNELDEQALEDPERQEKDRKKEMINMNKDGQIEDNKKKRATDEKSNPEKEGNKLSVKQEQEKAQNGIERARFVNRVRKVPGDYAAKYGVHHEMKKCFFSARVLLVEGITELHILRALFDFILNDILNNKEEMSGCPKGHYNIKPSDVLKQLLIKEKQSEEEFADNLLRTFTSIQVVSAGSKTNFKDAEKFCHNVKVSVMVLEDNDKICHQREKGTLNSPEELNASKEEWRKKKKKENKFFWEDGTIEDALRADCPRTIRTIIDSEEYINCTNLDWEKTHKNTLKNSINDGLEDDKYSELFNELFKQIEKNKSSEFSKFFEFINDQDFV